MSINGNFLAYALVMLVAGLGIPVLAALNGGLGARLQNPALATTILFGVALVLSVACLAASGNFPRAMPVAAPWHLYLGGVFVVFYVLSVTWIAPRFGVGNAIAFVLLGQLASMAAIDHFALLGAPRNPVDAGRFFGLALMAIGVFFAVRRA
ncbi:MAG TPA: DMT family transporter [Pseudolabrys sp.]|jgi:transporter family-2 protein|nr:DMT family transporter [Pseudolabrys sp.]